jgi:hypothetical protein
LREAGRLDNLPLRLTVEEAFEDVAIPAPVRISPEGRDAHDERAAGPGPRRPGRAAIRHRPGRTGRLDGLVRGAVQPLLRERQPALAGGDESVHAGMEVHATLRGGSAEGPRALRQATGAR